MKLLRNLSDIDQDNHRRLCVCVVCCLCVVYVLCVIFGTASKNVWLERLIHAVRVFIVAVRRSGRVKTKKEKVLGLLWTCKYLLIPTVLGDNSTCSRKVKMDFSSRKKKKVSFSFSHTFFSATTNCLYTLCEWGMSRECGGLAKSILWLCFGWIGGKVGEKERRNPLNFIHRLSHSLSQPKNFFFSPHQSESP